MDQLGSVFLAATGGIAWARSILDFCGRTRPGSEPEGGVVTEVLFYHLESRPLEGVLPVILERSLERGWRVVVHTTLEERVDALDAHLWTFRDDSFLPHGTFRDTTAPDQPVLLTVRDDNPNGATVRILIDGAPVPADISAYQRVVLMFDGGDAAAVAAAREAWQAVKAHGCDASYWRAGSDGRWQRRG